MQIGRFAGFVSIWSGGQRCYCGWAALVIVIGQRWVVLGECSL